MSYEIHIKTDSPIDIQRWIELIESRNDLRLNENHEVRLVVFELARVLNATVMGDEGEEYACFEAERKINVSVKPCWKLW